VKSFLKISLLLGLCRSFSFAGPAEIAAQDTGAFEFGGISFGLVLSETGNKPTAQNKSSVTPEAGYPKKSEGVYELRGTFKVGVSKNEFPFRQTIKKTSAGYDCFFQIDGLNSNVIDVRLAATLPAKIFGGKKIALDKKVLPLPVDVEGYELASDQTLRKLRLPGAEGNFEIKNPGFKVFVQDRRKIGGTWFELRIQLPPGENPNQRSLAFQLDTAPSKIEASGEDASLETFPNVVVQKDVSFLGEDRAEKMDLYLPQAPDSKKRFPAVLVIHGGGWATGDKADRREIQICQTLAKAGFAAASINYLLCVKTPTWPTNIHDVKTGIRYLRANAAKLGIDPENLGTIGGSAGGHIAMLMGWSGDDARLDPPLFPGVSTKIKAVVDLYGVPDLRQPLSKGRSGCGEAWIGKKVAEAPEMFDLLSPVSRVEKNGAPVFILHGTKDATVPISYSETLVKILKEKEAVFKYKVVDDAPHTFLIDSQYGDFRKEIVDFFRTYLK